MQMTLAIGTEGAKVSYPVPFLALLGFMLVGLSPAEAITQLWHLRRPVSWAVKTPLAGQLTQRAWLCNVERNSLLLGLCTQTEANAQTACESFWQRPPRNTCVAQLTLHRPTSAAGGRLVIQKLGMGPKHSETAAQNASAAHPAV